MSTKAPQTPIEAWPPRRFTGKPGYSGEHFRMLAGAADDPLSVACRIARGRVTTIAWDTTKSSEENIAAVHGHEADRQARELAEYEHLKVSFDAVIAVLESWPTPAAMKVSIRDAKRARAKAVQA